MERFILLPFSVFFFCSFAIATINGSPKKTYIIQMDKSTKPEVFTGGHGEWYSSLVKSVVYEQQETGENSGEERVLYSYQTAFHGVAAQLTEEELQRLELKHGVLSVFPETVYQLHTTRSSLFLGLTNREASKNPWAGKLLNSNVVVGVLDTGIWPECPSFNDTGMEAVPAHWKGECEIGRGFTKQHCNRKVVGARVFYQGYEASSGKISEQGEYKSPRDQDGHGTHTAATVAGSPVRGANLNGYAYGTAVGMAPGARIAAYKVCWSGGCFSSDILSAVDRAVADGVNVLSISLGGGVSSYGRDSLSAATFGAMEMGVFVSCSAGNSGPEPISLTNVSPWIATVGASTMDRDFPARIRLGTGKTYIGASLYKGQASLSVEKQYPLIYMGNNNSSPAPGSLCLEGALDRRVVAGKIVICDRGVSPRVQKGRVVKNAGGIGMILSNTAANGEELVADSHLLPAAGVGETAGKEIKKYASSTRNPTATLEFLGTKTGVKPAPIVAAFSSRGPNILSFEILKPDFVAPGVNILAGWTGDLGPSSLPTDIRRTKFNVLSGTSMSCPHVSGVAALLKAKHPEWSPAAIKSALMTTAYVHDNTFKNLIDASTGKESTAYDHGAGHINPLKAVDPGLIYDITPQDYFDFLCTQDIEPSQLHVFGKFSNRSCKHTISRPGDLNYPAISVLFPEDSNVSAVTFRRTVTNVGPPISSYRLAVSEFRGATIKVEPKRLNFTKKLQKLSFKITFIRKVPQTGPEFGSMVWKDGSHKVRSPIIVTWLTPL